MKKFETEIKDQKESICMEIITLVENLVYKNISISIFIFQYKVLETTYSTKNINIQIYK